MPSGTDHRGLTRLLLGERPSALERLNPQRFPTFLRSTISRWMSIVGVAAFGALIAIGQHVSGFRFWPLMAMVAVLWTTSFVIISRRDDRVLVLTSYFVVVISPFLGLAVWWAGPNFAAVSVIVPMWVCGCFSGLRRRTSLIATLLGLSSVVAVMLLADGYDRPIGQAIFLAGIVAGGVQLFLLFATELEVIAARLEERVGEQGGEIERLGQLRRFLTPQIAESVLSGDTDLLATHRRRIAVFFCDLRGFTRFSSTAEPEDIAEVLTEYYETLGHAIEAHGATIGGFAGDGVWAFFNDPFPIDDPAGHAFAMAVSLKEPMRAMRQAWDRRGFQLGYGMSVAYGYATMSTIGFETRSEYTAVGTVVNLGARLCDKAEPNELLIDARAYSELTEDVGGEASQLMLKGFNDPVTAYRIAL